MIKVVIVDDHPIVADGIRQLISEEAGMDVVGTAMCGKDCKELLQNTTPDIILLDINLPDMNGMDLCAYVHNRYPFIRIIALTGFKEYFYMQKMLQNGASGYLLKNALPEEILEGIRSVYKGERYFSEEAGSVISARKEKGKLFLTIRETELLSLIVEGYTNKEIAEKLFLGVETVNSYRKNLLLKLGVKNTAAMVKLAITEKLI
ncbi:response regulator [Parabacteroides chinchillae]|uniref:Two component transcriptional regulator, LuxR family n=1 Tax=Parabacteroides chinchillae TaxID=871327 RepID=A0A8G2BYC4_9BACT|nr:response regulator transcription factor [Parabacteroides chinchillae]SEG17816.1 two component transcriptional regulator, LuxR family [Parabacteroides chinchillae]